MAIKAHNLIVVNKGIYDVHPVKPRKSVARPVDAKTNDRIINLFIIEREDDEPEVVAKVAMPPKLHDDVVESRVEAAPKSLFSDKTSPFLSDMLDS